LGQLRLGLPNSDIFEKERQGVPLRAQAKFPSGSVVTPNSENNMESMWGELLEAPDAGGKKQLEKQ
jgi:hypothetical protein